MSDTPTDSAVVEHTQDSQKRKREDEEAEGGDAVQATTATDSNPPLKRKRKDNPKKYALYIAYSGFNYKGLQYQKTGETTIESVLLKALFDIGAIEKHEIMTGWARSCRTDKGVHALRNIITAKILPVVAKADDFLEKLNDKLPADIRVFGIRRVTDFFSAKNHCKRRWYTYLLPTYTIIKKHSLFGPKPATTTTTDATAATATTADATTVAVEETWFEKLNRLLSKYVGTHNFHNFTVDVRADEPRALRHIVHFFAEEPFTVNNREYVKLRVYGQSFMLHQIRKMVAMIVAVMRGVCSEETMDKALNAEFDFNLPMAPPSFLWLEKAEFPQYNKGDYKPFEPIEWDAEVERRIDEEFKPKLIEGIINADAKSLEMATWVFDLDTKHAKFYKPQQKRKNNNKQKAKQKQTARPSGSTSNASQPSDDEDADNDDDCE